MNTLLFFLGDTPPNWFIWSAGFASLLTLMFLVFYFIRPILKINIYEEKNKIKVKCTNKNIFRNPIREVKCYIVSSANSGFNIVHTEELEKDYIPGIKFCDNYVFKTKNTVTQKKRYIKVRILALNSIGIKKLYTRTYEIKGNTTNIKSPRNEPIIICKSIETQTNNDINLHIKLNLEQKDSIPEEKQKDDNPTK